MKRLVFLLLPAALACAPGVAASGPAQILRAAMVKTDSCAFDYENKMLCDGVREPVRWQEAWLSSEGTNAPRWVELAFTSDVPVRTVAIFWGAENASPAASRAYAIQAWQTNAFTNAFANILEVKDNPPAARSVHTFDAVSSKRFRVLQQPGCGSAARPNGMWIAEIELYGVSKPDSEFGTTADLNAARQLRHEVRDRTIGVHRRSRGYWGRSGGIARLLMRSGWRVIQLDYLDERELGLCRAAVICSTRAIPNMHILSEYVRNGGGLMLLHDSCGRGPGSVFPDIWEYKDMAPSGRFSLAGAAHPITRGITNEFATTYGEYAVLKAGPKGTALVLDGQGRDVAVAGRHGGGRAIAIGTLPGMSSGTNWNELKSVTLGPGESAFITNAAQWLAGGSKLRDPWKKPFWAAGPMPRKTLFENVTDQCGMAYGGYSKSVAMADANNDGRLEIFATQCKIEASDPCHNLFYRNDGDWKFTEIGKQAGVQLPHGIGSAFGDVDGDGKTDLFVSWMPEMAGKRSSSALFLGNGGCAFSNATAEAGLDNLGQACVCILSDVDNDGDLDLYVAGFEQENRLCLNRGNGIFDDATRAMGLADLGAAGEKGYGGNMACGMGDLNGDGYADLAAYNRGVLHIFRNNGGKGFADVPEYMGSGRSRLSGGSIGLTMGDFDNDGDLDVYVGGRNALLRNDGDFKFADVTAGSGLDTMERNSRPYGQSFVDWNNDGRLDLFFGNGGFDSFAFENNGDGTFKDVSGAIGLDVYGVHGFNFGDLDNDGDLDFYATAWGRHPSALLRNNRDDGNALIIRIKGRKSNTSGVGAKVWVYEEPSGTNMARRLRGYREVCSGGGSLFSGASLDQHVGLGPGGGLYTVETLFPVSGKRVTVSNAVPFRILTIEEPGDTVEDEPGNGFSDLGVAVPISCTLSYAVTTNKAGKNVVLAWLNDHRGEYALLEIDPDTGKSEQHPVPEASGSAFGSLLSSRNRFYKHFGNHFYEYDPAARSFTFWTNTATGGSDNLIEDEKGVIWSISGPQSGLVSFDPGTRAFKDYGHLYKQNFVQYPGGLSMDDTGWVYWSVGKALCQVVAFNPGTGAVKPLLKEEERSLGHARIYQDVNGKVYGRARRNGEWFECHAGVALKIDGRPPMRRCYRANRGDNMSFTDGRRLAGIDLEKRVLVVNGPGPNESRRIPFSYESDGAHVMGLAAAPDGTICGGGSFPMVFFAYDPETGHITNRAVIGQWNTMNRQGSRLYAGCYTGGYLLEWDTARPWVEPRRGDTNSNPLFLGENREVMNRPHDLLPLDDGRTIVMSGSPCYGMTGGGLVFWDSMARTTTQVQHTDIIPEHTTMSMAPMPGGKFLGGTSTRPGSGGIRKAKEAELYIMDARTKKIEWHAAIFPGAHEYTDMCLGTNGLVYGLVGFVEWHPLVLKYGKRFFVFDPAARRVIHEQDTEAEFGPVSYQQGPRNLFAGPDGSIYILFLKGIARFDPASSKISLLAESPVPIVAGGEMLNGRIYFSSGSRLYSYSIPPGS